MAKILKSQYINSYGLTEDLIKKHIIDYQGSRRLQEAPQTINNNTITIDNISQDQLPYKVITFEGTQEGELSGFSAVVCGDINNKGEPDYIIGAPAANGSTGRAYVIDGETSFEAGTNINLGELQKKGYGFVIDGVEPKGEFGFSAYGGIDVNRDGIADFIISAPFANNGAGISYVFYGSTASSNINLGNFSSSQGFKIIGDKANSYSGYSVSLVNENNEIYALIGVPYDNNNKQLLNGAVYKVMIPEGNHSDINLGSITNNQNNGQIFGGEDSLDHLGIDVADIGDIDGDGINDFAVTAHLADSESKIDNGAVYVIYGVKSGNLDIKNSLINLDSSKGFKITGASSADNNGFSITKIGDFNGDGVDDFAIGAPGASPELITEEPALREIRSEAGITYVIFGRKIEANQPKPYQNIDLNNLTLNQGIKIFGPNAGARSGFDVSGLGDVNDHGPNDLLIAIPGNGGYFAVVYGCQPESCKDIDLKNISQEQGIILNITNKPGHQAEASAVAISSKGNLLLCSSTGDGAKTDSGKCVLLQKANYPTSQPSSQPSVQPTTQPSTQPSAQPTAQPSSVPSSQPSTQPISKPSTQPSSQPSAQPSVDPSGQPTSQPSAQPTGQPSSYPSSQPSAQPSGEPSGQPTSQPSAQPTGQPSSYPSTQPSSVPSSQPSSAPSAQPSGVPTGQPSSVPSSVPSSGPSGQPSAVPTGQPSSVPSSVPSSEPSGQPSGVPTTQPSGEPSGQPTSQPSAQPTSQPSSYPSSYPSTQPTTQPSTQPSTLPSSEPSAVPSGQPSGVPTTQPSSVPSIVPSSAPSGQPSGVPSAQPSAQPTSSPTFNPYATPCFNEEGKQTGERLYVDHNGDGYLDVICINYDGSTEYHEFRDGSLIARGPLTSTNSTSIEVAGNITITECQIF